ncbi:hypothetical protein SLS53_008421 [Cytospora paraplurivora]|uniref:non-specific serine/threonine protein kinase n=1 Tax=Cytospora paraplurivora TaxID=2898453 RepID=A0AAN9TZ24_9PEZI
MPVVANSGSSVNSNELRKGMYNVTKEELGIMYTDIPRFHDAFFGPVAELEEVSNKVFDQCQEGPTPLFNKGHGWTGWPQDAREAAVLSWFADITKKLATFAMDLKTSLMPQRRPLARPTKQFVSSTAANRKLDIGFVDHLGAKSDTECHWSRILVPGELKSNPEADKPSQAPLDLGRYVREVMSAQPTRRFVLSFTLCGSVMRVWEFDRVGAIASEQFDINEDGRQFVLTILGFLCMSKEQIGFDPTIKKEKGEQFTDIQRDSTTERLIIERLISHSYCIVGRATTCWKAYTEGSGTPLVIKDSWQYPERDEEGELLRKVAEKNVVNVARYYHHETVCVGGQIDQVQENIRHNLDITDAERIELGTPVASPTASTTGTSQQYRSGNSTASSLKRTSSQLDAALPASKRALSKARSKPTESATGNPQPYRSRNSIASSLKRTSSQLDAALPASKRALSKARSKPTESATGNPQPYRSGNSIASSLKRTSSQLDAALPASKRARSRSQSKPAEPPSNRVHRRVIVRDYGKPIYLASSPSALLDAVEGCITGHESLYKAGFLHRDISINNLMINEDVKDNCSWRSFLIDLDLAIETSRSVASGAKGRTGTRAFMAIGVLQGEQHSFMHDLESFFWVLFWICIHYDGPGKGRVVDDFEQWNYIKMDTLALLKGGTVADKPTITRAMTDNFTPYFESLIPWVTRLWEVTFPNGKRHYQDDEKLYSRMRDVLQRASKDLAKATPGIDDRGRNRKDMAEAIEPQRQPSTGIRRSERLRPGNMS